MLITKEGYDYGKNNAKQDEKDKKARAPLMKKFNASRFTGKKRTLKESESDEGKPSRSRYFGGR